MKKLYTLAVILFFFCPRITAQIKYCGKDFFFSLGGATGDTAILFSNPFAHAYNTSKIQLASAHYATVKFHYKATGIVNTYSVVPNVPLIVTLTQPEINSIIDHTDDIVRNRSMEITSDSDITVSFNGGDGAKADDGMMILPCDGQKRGDKYMLLGMHSGDAFHVIPRTYSIVSTCDNVVLQIIPAANTNNHAAGVPYTVTMNKGQEFRVGTPSIAGTMAITNDDITGTQINVISSPSCFPIEVFVTYDAIYQHWPTTATSGACCADILLEQLLPINYWDTSYPVAPFMYDSLTVIRVLSASNGNTIYYDHHPIKVLNQGEFLDTLLFQVKPAIISGASPIGVAQFMVSNTLDSGLNGGDPDMLWCYAMKQGVQDAVFQTYNRYVSPVTPQIKVYYWLNVISESANIASIKLNGNPVSPSLFRPFSADPNYKYAAIPLKMDSVYHLTSAKKVIAYHYQEEMQGSYSFELADLRFTFGNGEWTYKTDTVRKCIGATATLTANESQTYEWTTGATTRSITVSGTGLFTVDEVTADECVSSKVRHSFFIKEEDTTVINKMVAKCAGSPVMINADAAQSYTWTTGDTTQGISVISTGKYQVTTINTDTCIHVTAHTFDVRDRIYPAINLGGDTIVCKSDKFMLKTPYNNAIWSTGATGAAIEITTAGIYFTTAIDSCEVMHTDTVEITISECIERYCNLVFPNAFSPNDDGKNDVFRAIQYGKFTKYSLIIYNRWGEQVFATNKVDDGWNGAYKGVASDVGVYYFYCTLDCPAKGKTYIKGDVTLVR